MFKKLPHTHIFNKHAMIALKLIRLQSSFISDEFIQKKNLFLRPLTKENQEITFLRNRAYYKSHVETQRKAWFFPFQQKLFPF